MTRALLILPALMLTVAVASADPGPVPDADALDEAKKQIEEKYKTEYAKKAAHFVLAQKLAEKAETTKDAAQRFVMLREARDIATRLGMVDLALQASTSMARFYQVNEFELRLECLESMSKLIGVSQKLMMEAALEVVDEAIRVNAYKNVERALKVAAVAGGRLGPATTNLVAARTKQAEAAGKAFETLADSFKTLASKPNDPAANGKVGRYNCLLKGDWNAGLPMLERSDDEAMKAAAALDIKSAKREERIAAADRWMELVEKVEPAERAAIRVHAHEAYSGSADDVSGEDRKRVYKVLALLEKDPAIQRADFGAWTVLFRSSNRANWNKKVNHGRNDFAMQWHEASEATRFVKLTMVGGRVDPVIAPVTRSGLGSQAYIGECRWYVGNPQQMGIYNPEWRDFSRDSIRIKDENRGWGFGLTEGSSVLRYTWAGEPVDKCVFEVAVKSFALTAQESKYVPRKEMKSR